MKLQNKLKFSSVILKTQPILKIKTCVEFNLFLKLQNFLVLNILNLFIRLYTEIK